MIKLLCKAIGQELEKLGTYKYISKLSNSIRVYTVGSMKMIETEIYRDTEIEL